MQGMRTAAPLESPRTRTVVAAVGVFRDRCLSVNNHKRTGTTPARAARGTSRD